MKNGTEIVLGQVVLHLASFALEKKKMESSSDLAHSLLEDLLSLGKEYESNTGTPARSFVERVLDHFLSRIEGNPWEEDEVEEVANFLASLREMEASWENQGNQFPFVEALESVVSLYQDRRYREQAWKDEIQERITDLVSLIADPEMVRSSEDLTHWVLFFSESLLEQALGLSRKISLPFWRKVESLREIL